MTGSSHTNGQLVHKIFHITKMLKVCKLTVVIITACGIIHEQTRKTVTDPFVLPTGAEYATRKDQNPAQICCCLMTKITDDSKAKVIAFQSQFKYPKIIKLICQLHSFSR